MGSWGIGQCSDMEEKWGHHRDCRGATLALWLEKALCVQAFPGEPLDMELAGLGSVTEGTSLAILGGLSRV